MSTRRLLEDIGGGGGFLPGPGPIFNSPTPAGDCPGGIRGPFGVCVPIAPFFPSPTQTPLFPELPSVPSPVRPFPPTSPGKTGGCSVAPVASSTGQLCCPPGFRLSTVKDKCSGQMRQCCVKRRRMNPFNPKANARATRRLVSAVRRNKAMEKALRKLAGPLGGTRRRAAPARKCSC